MKSLVSIIIPNYNEKRFIEKTVDSALNQTYDNTEIIIVDDGSTDGSYDILKRLEADNSRITVLRQENMNASIARNRGFEHSNGEYIYFLDSDDLAKTDAIEKLVKAAEETGADLVIGNMDEIDEEDKLITTDIFFNECGESDDFTKFISVLPAPPNKLYRAEVMRRNGVVFGNVRLGQDTNFFLKYLLCAKKIAYIDDVIYSWRIVKSGMTHSTDFHIFDIAYSFKDTKKFYLRNYAEDKYMDYIRMYEYQTYYRQMDKQWKFAKRSDRNLVIGYFKHCLESLGDVTQCQNFGEFKDAYRKCRLKLRLRWLYGSKLFGKFYQRKNAETIVK